MPAHSDDYGAVTAARRYYGGRDRFKIARGENVG
jgi:hypothetical protein